MVKESYRMFVVRKEVGGYFRFGGPAGVFVAWFYSCLPHPFPFARALILEGEKWNTLTAFVKPRAGPPPAAELWLWDTELKSFFSTAADAQVKT